MPTKTAIIIGAGPAGLTAALELLDRTEIIPIIIEQSNHAGGISKTINFEGKKIDIGGHRFFSKSDRVNRLWQELLPVYSSNKEEGVSYHNKSHLAKIYQSTQNEKEGILIRTRLSRIYYNGNLFDYPLSLNWKTLKQFGGVKVLKFGMSFLIQKLKRRKENSLEDFLINRFGNQLYLNFFKSYTEKVWGVVPGKISAEWGKQRIKGISLWQVVKDIFIKTSNETSLINKFFYPAQGPGQIWQRAVDKIYDKGGEIRFESRVIGFEYDYNSLTEVKFEKNGELQKLSCDYLFSSMPVKHLCKGLESFLTESVFKLSQQLLYRDFIIVGIVCEKMNIKDNWIYIQEEGFKVGRLQVFDNWSPYMNCDKSISWIGMEYFCSKNDNFWNKTDDEIKSFAIEEFDRLGLSKSIPNEKSIVVREEKAYPSYFGAYKSFDKIKRELDKLENLFLIGRNGMHKYNNQDHSMLTAMTAVDLLCKDEVSKEDIWRVNTEMEYNEN